VVHQLTGGISTFKREGGKFKASLGCLTLSKKKKKKKKPKNIRA
jgi:hypothetical protein